ncbi:AAA domain-containing protein [Cohaesibacter marisflavi]|uniref:AAA domain-containing protein n=2 Tax=Cohaesibacter marisflavi TaxID=655353 RepID=A0A1I5C2D5_9HYPH|nr:AAA domain-containing protein [Cohaesibacter marisflavi]
MDIRDLIDPISRELCGEPNKHLSKNGELRFGNRGSLSVKTTGEEKGTFFNHETNEGGGVIDLVMEKRGCSKEDAGIWIDLRFGSGFRQHQNRSNIVAAYDYVDEEGCLLFQVVRMDPKDFRQRRPKPGVKHPQKDSDWEWKVKGTRLAPYRLPELLEAIAQEQPIYIVEGEKDVERLEQLGIVATCNPGGAKKWPESVNSHFLQADVFIIPDNDDAGREHRDIVARSLDGIARRIRVLDLPNLPKKGDVSDWLEGGRTIEEFYRLSEVARDWEPAPTPTHFPMIWYGEEDNLPPRSWLVKKVLATGEMSVIYGPSGVGKSFLAIDLGLRIAAGLPWFENKVLSGPVVYVAGEGGTGARQRLKAWREHQSIDTPIPFVMIPKAVDMRSPDSSDISSLAADIKEIGRRAGSPVSLIIIDTLSRMMAGGTDADPRDMASFIVQVEKLREKTNAHVLIVHHTGKDRDRGMRGATTLRDCSDTVIELEKAGDSDICKATIDKQKDGEDGTTFRFKLSQVALGLDEDGDEITSCIVEPTGNSEGERGDRPRLSGAAEIARRALNDALVDDGQSSPGGKIIPENVRVVSIEAWRARAYLLGISPTGSDEAKKKAFQRACRTLQEKGLIGICEPYVWNTRQ